MNALFIILWDEQQVYDFKFKANREHVALFKGTNDVSASWLGACGLYEGGARDQG